MDFNWSQTASSTSVAGSKLPAVALMNSVDATEVLSSGSFLVCNRIADDTGPNTKRSLSGYSTVST